MITQFIINLFLHGLRFILGWLPSPDNLPSFLTNVNDSLDNIATYMGKANAILPIDVIFTIAGLVFVIESGILLFKVGNWLFDKIRGAG